MCNIATLLFCYFTNRVHDQLRKRLQIYYTSYVFISYCFRFISDVNFLKTFFLYCFFPRFVNRNTVNLLTIIVILNLRIMNNRDALFLYWFYIKKYVAISQHKWPSHLSFKCWNDPNDSWPVILVIWGHWLFIWIF